MRERQHQAAAADDGHAPEHRPVVELLPVGPAVETGRGPLPKNHLNMPTMSCRSFQFGHQRIRAEPAEGLAVAHRCCSHVDEVDEEDADERSPRRRGGSGRPPRRRRAPAPPPAPRRCRENSGMPVSTSVISDQGEGQVGDAPAEREALERASPRACRQRLGTHVRARLAPAADPAIRGRTTARNASQKKANTPISRATMNLVGDPHLRIVLEVVACWHGARR